MKILIILIIWFAVGFIYLINLSGSKEIENLSNKSIAIILLIFFPTSIVIFLILGIEKIIKRIKNGRFNKGMQRSNKTRKMSRMPKFRKS